MNAITEMAAALTAALKTVPGCEVPDTQGANLDPPSLVLSPPALTWEGLCSGPTSATWLVFVVVAAEERALERLWDLLPQVTDAIDAVTDAAVIRADPGAFRAGATDLPCYEITVEVSL